MEKVVVVQLTLEHISDSDSRSFGHDPRRYRLLKVIWRQGRANFAKRLKCGNKRPSRNDAITNE
jgi:hypothetical protein